MASMFQSLLERAAQLLTPPPSTGSSSSSSSLTSRSQISKELRKLHRRMKRIQALLSDAEQREIRENSVRLWLAELRDVASRSEDVLDEVEYEVLRYQLDCEHVKGGDTHEKRGIEGKRENASFHQQILTEIEEINDLLDEIHGDGLALRLNEGVGVRHTAASVSETSPWVPTSCLVDQQGVRGRDYDVHKVVHMLLLPDENVGVFSIVGSGGVGKTTLAQLVYNDDRVVDHFERRMWVWVSQTFDAARLTKEILEAAPEVGGISSEVQMPGNFSSLQQSLHKKLQGQRFLLVLDDVWNEDQAQWDALWVCLSRGATGSRVLITTRSEKVSKTSRVSEANRHRLGCLSYEDSWSLFEHRAFGGKNSSEYPKLVPIGRDIVKKCGGLPLAVKTLAGLLFCESEEDRWRDILRSELWEIPEVEDHILPALKLSYHHLPSALKPCFAVCAVLPKGRGFYSDELVRMWMAHGYIRPSASRCTEDVGRRYFEDLLQRSFFQEGKLKIFGRCCFTMHDLIHDLVSSIGGGECCQVVDGRLPGGRARHLAFDYWEDISRLLSHGAAAGDNLMMKRWWTCWLRRERGQTYDTLNDMFMRMKYLRVLHLGDALLKKLPDSVGNLKHLRYLCIAGSDLTRLPESLGDLLNLQILEITGQFCFKKLPRRLEDLVNLQHLYFATIRAGEIPTLSMMPHGIGRLTQLRTLPLFVVGKGSDAAGIEELTDLNHLQGELEILIKSLDNWVKWSSGRDDCGKEACILKNKQGLKSFTFQFADIENPPHDRLPVWAAMKQQDQQQERLLESLQPHTNIKEICIFRYGGGRFPEWMGNPSSERLERIHLATCDNCRQLPALGQLPSLKQLEVWSLDAVTSVSELFEAASFMSLEDLVLGGLWTCEGSLSIGTERGDAFPHLCKLTIKECPKLEHVKLRHLTALRELQIRHCRELSQLDYYNDDNVIVPLPPPSGLHPQQVLINDHMHIPGVHIMILRGCPNLNFPSAKQQQQQLLPPSLWRFDSSGSPLLSEWARNHRDRLVHLTCLLMDDGPREKLLSLLNVRDVNEACAWDYLPCISGAQKLELRWDDVEQQGSSSCSEAEQVLCKLDPPGNLEELVIQGYRGRSFPYWVEDTAYHRGRLKNLVKMTLAGCIHCNSLPPLGQLPSLRQLYISRMPNVRHVGREFCGCGNGVAFQLLQTLEFHDMPQWEAWQGVKDGAFPNLQVLRIYNCPNLTTIKLTVSPQFELESDTFKYVGTGHFSRRLNFLVAYPVLFHINLLF